MLITARNGVRLGAIVLGIVFASFPIQRSNAQQRGYTWRNVLQSGEPVSPARTHEFAVFHAQNTTADSFNFDEITAGGEDEWTFPSENETVSLKDEIQQLGDYNISDADNFSVKLVQENRTWANKGDRPYYYIENRVAPYYSIKTRVYDY